MLNVLVLGRPNVGKSTLVNRIIEKKSAITSSISGTTRDLANYKTEWNGVDLNIIDSAGYLPTSNNEIDKSTTLALETALLDTDVVLFIADGSVLPHKDDKRLTKLLLKNKNKVVFVLNKVDNLANLNDCVYKYGVLGLDEPFLISALQGKNIGNLLDIIVNSTDSKPQPSKRFPKDTPQNSDVEKVERLTKIAIIGKPNVGKSSLLNNLSKKQRALVNNKAGTTRDAILETISIGGCEYEFVDTAGIRKKLYKDQGPDFYANSRTKQVIISSDICILMIDVTDLSVQNIKLLNLIIEAGKGIIIIFNKYDLLNEYKKSEFKKYLETDFSKYSWVPYLRGSALTGKNIHRLESLIKIVETNINFRISTPAVNRFIGFITKDRPPLPVKGKATKISYSSQVSTKPTVFTLWSNNEIKRNYFLFLTNKIRENFNFTGVPIKIEVKLKPKSNLRFNIKK